MKDGIKRKHEIKAEPLNRKFFSLIYKYKISSKLEKSFNRENYFTSSKKIYLF